MAYLTADNAMGKSIDVPELKAYLTGAGYEFVGSQFVALEPTSPPTAQLAWLKENKVDLALGVMINSGSQPTIKEATRLGMGPNLEYKITFGFGTPSHLAVFAPVMGSLGDGVVVAGSFPSLDDLATLGIKFANDLQSRYRPDNKITHIMYIGGILEAMIQVEAIRLTLLEKPVDQLKPVDVLEYGFYRIKALPTGDLSATPLTLGPGDIEGVDEVRVDQAQNGKIVKLGSCPTRHIYAK